MLLGLIIIVVAYILITKKNKKNIEQFNNKTNNGKKCIPWKEAIQYKNYDGNNCRNPENDINGSWCYTDQYGNFDYCNKYKEGCMDVKILDSCFNPDSYHMVISKSQPFNEEYLELDKIVDSSNYIWCLDKSGKFLRIANKKDYINYQWTDLINDSLYGYDPTETGDFNIISSFGVKQGGYIETRKNNSNKEENSVVASEVCYLFLKNVYDKHKMVRCFAGDKINIHDDSNKLEIESSDSIKIEMGKKIMIDKKGYIFGIHKEKFGKENGVFWGDMIIGKEDTTGETIEFKFLGNTFAKNKGIDLEKTIKLEGSDNLFDGNILSFVKKYSYELNASLADQSGVEIEEIILKLLEDKNKGYKRYLKYRILLNNDFNFNFKLTDLFKKDENDNEDNINYFMENKVPALKNLNTVIAVKEKLFDNTKVGNEIKFVEEKKILTEIKKLKDYEGEVSHWNDRLAALTIGNLEDYDKDLNKVDIKKSDFHEFTKIREKITELKNLYDEKSNILKENLEKQEFYNIYNEICNDMIKKKKTEFDLDLIIKMNNYFASKTKFLYKNINLIIKGIKDYIEGIKDYIENELKKKKDFCYKFNELSDTPKIKDPVFNKGAAKIYIEKKEKIRKIEDILRSVGKIKYRNLINNGDKIYDFYTTGNPPKYIYCESYFPNNWIQYDIQTDKFRLKFRRRMGWDYVESYNNPGELKIKKFYLSNDDTNPNVPRIDLGINTPDRYTLNDIKKIFGKETSETIEKYDLADKVKKLLKKEEEKHNEYIKNEKEGLKNKLKAAYNRKKIKQKGEYIEDIKKTIEDIELLLENKNNRQLLGNVELSLLRTRENLKKLENDEPLAPADICKYNYYPPSGPSESVEREERNCFQDFVTEYTVKIDSIVTLFGELKEKCEIKEFNLNHDDDEKKLEDLQRWTNEKWDNYLIPPTTTAGTYTIQQKVNDRYLDAYETSSSDYRAVTRTIQNNDSQKWIIKRLSGDEYTIQQKGNNRYLDASKKSKKDYRAVTRTAQNDDSQKWILTYIEGEKLWIPQDGKKLSPKVVQPKLVEDISYLNIKIHNLKRKEELLRYNSTFFYILDKYLEIAKHNESKDKGNILKVKDDMINLFFDKTDANNFFNNIRDNTPIESKYDGKKDKNDEFLDKLYNQNNIKSSIFSPTITNNYDEYDTYIKSPSPSASIFGEKCDYNSYTSRRFLDELELKKQVFDSFKKKFYLNIQKLDKESTNSQTPTITRKNAYLAKENIFYKFIMNNINDDTRPFGSDTIKEIFVDIRQQIDSFKESGNTFNEGEFQNQKKNKIKEIEGSYEEKLTMLEKEQTKIDAINITGAKNPIPDFTSIKLFTPSSSFNDDFDEDNFRDKLIDIEKKYNNFEKYIKEIYDILIKKIPNKQIINYHTYLRYFTDNNIKTLDIDKKMDFVKETLKIMGEITNIAIHRSLNFGVIDFNLTDTYLYIDYLEPNAGKFDIKTFKLKKEYIDYYIKDEEGFKELDKIDYLEKDNYNEKLNDKTPTKLDGKLLHLYENDNIIRDEIPICQEIINQHNEENEVNEENKKNNNYKPYKFLFKNKLFMDLNEEINSYKFLEQGTIFIREKNIDSSITKPIQNNNLYIKKKNYDTNKNIEEQLSEYNDDVKKGLENEFNPEDKNSIRYFYDNSKDKLYIDLKEEAIYNIIPGTIYGSSNIYGLLKYNNNSNLEKNRDEKLKSIKTKKNVFYQIYGKPKGQTQIGPIELVNKTFLGYILTPEIKYTHGLIFDGEDKIRGLIFDGEDKIGGLEKNKSYFGLLYWFFLQQKEKKFKNVGEWIELYKTLKSEGMYNIAANPKLFNLNTNFTIQFEDYRASLESNPIIGRLSKETLEILVELKKFKYDKDLKFEKKYPQINFHILKNKKYGNQVFIEVVRFTEENIEIKPSEIEVITLILDNERNFKEKTRKENDKFKKKYGNDSDPINPIQDIDRNVPFNYNYYRLIKDNKFNLLADNNFCQNSDSKNRFNSLWRYKIINNFDNYKELVEGKNREESINRIKGLYEISNIYKDESYYKFIEEKNKETSDESIKLTTNKIINNKKKNILIGTGYPFMVIYQVRDYKGLPCYESAKDSQKIFLTYNLDENYIDENYINSSSIDSLVGLHEGPIISEEFLSYTGIGSTIRFAYQRARGETSFSVKEVCPASGYEALPGYTDDCGVGNNCGKKVMGLTRLDGTTLCGLKDEEVKINSPTSLEVSMPGNVSQDECDIFKIKGNKKIKYSLGKIYGYNNAGKYQLKNQYTLKYGIFYFKYNTEEEKIEFTDEFDNNPKNIIKYSFNLTYGEDNYGYYILLSPHYTKEKGDNTKYLTRVINIFDKHFDEWKLEKKLDNIKEREKNFVRNNETKKNTIDIKNDLDFYAQKFNLPEETILKIASEEGIKSELLTNMKNKLEKNNYLFCNIGGQGKNSACKGNFGDTPIITLDEEREILRKQTSQIKSLMKRFDNIPKSHFDKFPENKNLLKFLKSITNVIEKAAPFIYKRIENINWVVKTQIEENGKVTKQNNKILSAPTLSNTSMGDLVDEGGIMASTLKSMSEMKFNNTIENRQCKSIEGFQGTAGPSTSMDKNLSGKYYNYVKEQIDIKKKDISNINDKIHTLLNGLNKMSDGMELSGEKKQMLLSEMIQEKNNLNNIISDIKNLEQKDRLNKITDKITKVEDLRNEMEEDDFETKKPLDDYNNISIISREDGEFLNMYKINQNEDTDHLLFVNGGCLEYEPEKKDIKVSHCMANLPKQQFNIYRIEDKKDMDSYNLKNSENGMDRTFDIIKSKDGKCLHKEQGELSFRNCENIKNQYWDYSNITGPCKM